jgi:hypothetical protein
MDSSSRPLRKFLRVSSNRVFLRSEAAEVEIFGILYISASWGRMLL